MKEKHKTNETINYSQPKSIESPKIIETKTASTEHPKNHHILSKTIMHTKTVSQVAASSRNCNSPLYAETTKCKNFFNGKIAKTTQ